MATVQCDDCKAGCYGVPGVGSGLPGGTCSARGVEPVTRCERCHETGRAYWDGSPVYCQCAFGDARREADTVRAHCD